MTITAVSPDTFDAEVLQSARPVLVEFWASWCGHCRAFAPVLEEVAQEIGDAVSVVTVNVEEHQQLAARFHIRAVPTLLIFNAGTQIDMLQGEQEKNALLGRLRAL